MENTDFLKLKQQVESQNSKRKITKLQRKAIFWQTHLRDQGLDVEFSLMLSDLEPDQANKSIGPHGHNHQCYQLAWKSVSGNFGLFVTNIKARKTLPLVSCPEYLLEIIVMNMDSYLQRLSQYLADNSQYDEDYAKDTETDT